MEIKETLTRQVGNDIITMTDDRASLITSQISENNSKGIELYFNNCELIKEMRDNNGFYLLGYSSFKEYADEMFDSGETQAKNMCLIAKYFGKENDDKSWTIVDKEILKKFSATQLYYIGQLQGFDGSIAKAIEFYGFEYNEDKQRYTTTTAVLRELVKFEKNHKKALSIADVNELKSKLTTGNEPTGNEPTGNEPTGNEPTGNEPTGNEPTGNEPTGNEPTDKEKLNDYGRMKSDYSRVERLATTATKAIGDILIILDSNDKDKVKLDKIHKLILELKTPQKSDNK